MGYQSYVLGKGFWRGFERYIDNNWAQSAAIAAITVIITVGVQAIAAAVQNAGNKQALANAVEISKASALERAKELQKLPGSKRPTMTSAAVDLQTGNIYYGDSGIISKNINSALATQMPRISKTTWRVANCAEFNAVNNALNSGASIENLVVTTIRVKTLQMAPMCLNCAISLSNVLIVVSG